MKRIWLYILLAIFIVASTAIVAVGFIFSQPVVGIIFCFVTVVLLWLFFNYMFGDKIVEEFDRAFSAKDYKSANEIAQKAARKSAFYPILRLEFMLIRLCNALVQDELQEANRFIDVIRHNSGLGWQYRTAYYHVLIVLDKEDTQSARAEFEDFRKVNADVALYQNQIEVLSAIFSRLSGESACPLPQAALNSPFPVVQRILGRYIERQTALKESEWNE